MAKILIVFYQAILDSNNPNGVVCYYEAIAKELSKYDNEVLLLNTIFIKEYGADVCYKPKIEDYITSSVKQFAPDLILSFNNQITRQIIQNTNCPIFCVEADTIDLFASKNLIKEFIDRYYLANFYENFDIERYKSLGFDNSRICTLNQATGIRRLDLEKKYNISFIGTCFSTLSPQFNLSQMDKEEFIEKIKLYQQDNYKNFDQINDFCNKYTNDQISTYYMIDSRLKVLNSVWDLGLKLYGQRWNILSNENLILKLLYDRTPMYTLKHNEDTYNSSIINLSINHPQCKGDAFPWRCYDIMASSSILISSYSNNLKEKTKEYVDIPMYNSPAEARELCKYALKNPNYVKDISLASNEYIEKHARWKNNFQKIENLVGIKLINTVEQGLNKEYQIIKPLKVKIHKKIYHPGWALKFLLTQIPILNKIYPKQKKISLCRRIGSLGNEE